MTTIAKNEVMGECFLDETGDQKRQRLNSAQLIGHVLADDDSGNGCSPSEASTEDFCSTSSAPNTPPRRRITSGGSVWRGSDPYIGLANKCAELHQDNVGQGGRELRSIADVSAGCANIRDGKYLYVVMVADQSHVRLLHEDDMEELVNIGLNIGHTSLVDAEEFKRTWASSWDEAEPAHFRRTVSYAGELMYEEGEGVVWWNNQSGHYLPPVEGHTRVGFDPAAFAGMAR